MNTRTMNLTVASGATVSSTYTADGFSSFGLFTPANLAGTAITFEVGYAASGTITWSALTSSATSVPLNGGTVAASKAYPLPDALRPWAYFRLITPAQLSGAATFVVVGKSEA